MGRSNSKLATPNNPLQEMQLKEILRDQRKRKKEKEQKNLRKLQEKNAKRHKHKTTHNPKHAETPHQTRNDVRGGIRRYDISKEEYEQRIWRKLKNQLDNDLCHFILNQISLTLQFFGHFESEISSTNERIVQKENQLNQQLQDHSTLLANVIDAAVEKRIQYKPLHGPDKYTLQPLQVQTMYVVFENIDVARPNEANYDSISPICKVDMETDFFKTTKCNDNYADILRETKWKGYVRLKLRNDMATGEQFLLSDTSEGGNTNNPHNHYKKEVCGSRSITRNSSSSGYVSGPDYDYAYITHLNTHHPLSQLTMSNQKEKIAVDSKILPDSCVADFSDYIDHTCEEDEEEEVNIDEDQDSSVIDEDNCDSLEQAGVFALSSHRHRHHLLQPQNKYLNSKEFMKYFGDLLRRKLAPKLRLSTTEFEDGTYRGASIHTKNYEIIPAIHIAHNAQNWPDCAFQFKRRERPISLNPVTGQQFQWPTAPMIKRIESFGFHVIPLGYAPKKLKNPYRELEWKIVFPKAERYLESHLTNTQIKVFMMTKALVKTFVEPQEKDNTLMFTIDHLRMHLFWECERNFGVWPEEFLGEVLLRFIKSFMMKLREKQLQDFFIQERNLFESIPEYSLVRLYTTLAEILANPLMHIMVAFRNLHFVEEFIPKIDFKKIYNNLSENDYLHLKALSNNAKHLNTNVNNEPLRRNNQLMESGGQNQSLYDETCCGSRGLIGCSQQRDKTKGQLRRRTLIMKHNIEMLKKLEYERNRRSVDSIDVEYIFTKNIKDSEKQKDINQGVENLRRTNVLELILDNVIAMADKATDYRSIHLAKIYLVQAKRLCQFYNSYGCDMAAIEYMSSIESIESQIAILHQTESNIAPPALPIRISLEPVKSFWHTKDATDLFGKDCHQQKARQQPQPMTSRSCQYIRHVSKTKTSPPTTPDITNEPRRSIKFTDAVIEVEPAAMVRSTQTTAAQVHSYSPVSILRSTSGDNSPNISTDFESKMFTTFPEEIPTCASSSSPSPSPADEKEYSLLDKTLEEKRAIIRNMLRKKTVTIGGDQIQPSEL